MCIHSFRYSISLCVLSCSVAKGHVQPFKTPWAAVCQIPLYNGILQAGILEWIAISYSRGSSPLREWNYVPALAGVFVVVVVVVVFTTELPGKPLSISSECLLSDMKYTRRLSPKILKVPKIPVSPILTSFTSVWSHYLSLCICWLGTETSVFFPERF